MPCHQRRTLSAVPVRLADPNAHAHRSRSFKTAPVVAALKAVEQEQKRQRELREALAKRTQGLLDCSGFKEKHTLTQVLNELNNYGYSSFGSWTGALGDYLSPNMMKPTMKEREARTVAKNAFKIYQVRSRAIHRIPSSHTPFPC